MGKDKQWEQGGKEEMPEVVKRYASAEERDMLRRRSTMSGR